MALAGAAAALAFGGGQGHEQIVTQSVTFDVAGGAAAATVSGMTKYRDLDRGDVLPGSWLDALQEFISTLTSNLEITLLSTTAIRVQAGTGSDQVAVGIGGLWRFRSTGLTATASGAAGVRDIFVTATANAFTTSAGPDTDETDYNFGLQVLPAGTTPTGVAAFRRIGELDWDGAAITGLRQLDGVDNATLPLTPTAPAASVTPLVSVGAAGQAAPLISARATLAGTDVFSVSPAGVVRAATPATADDSTQLATTAFVKAQGYQAGDATLAALAAYNTNGLLTQTAADTFTGRTIVGTANQVAVTNGNGVAGNPTLSLPQSIDSAATVQFGNLGLGVAGSATARLSLATGTTEADGIIFGTGTDRANLFRSAADVLRTDDSLYVGGTQLQMVGGGTIYSRNLAATSSSAIMIRAAADTVDRLLVYGSGTLEWGPGNAARDTNLYRATTDVLGTDDEIRSTRGVTNLPAFAAWVTGDTVRRFRMDADGTMLWGPGNAAGDVNLFRGGEDVLQTADAFVAGGRLSGNATGAANNSTSGATNALFSPMNTISAFIGSTGSTAGYAATDASGVVRFNGSGVAWGDFGYFPTGGADRGHFRFMASANAFGTTPNARVGVGTLHVEGSATTGIFFGATQDTNLYRSTTATLKTDASLVVAGALSVTGTTSLTGTPTGPTAAADTNTTQLATTAFVVGQAASVAPLMAGTAAVGTSLRYARQDHVHPTDTSRQASDATLTALAAYNTNGLLTQTAADTFAGRTITGTAGQVAVTNGNGVAGNPTLSLPATLTQATTASAVWTFSANILLADGNYGIGGVAGNLHIDGAGDHIFRSNTGVERARITSGSTMRFGTSFAKATQQEFLQFWNATDGQDWSIYRAANGRDLFFYSATAGNAVRFAQSGPVTLASTLFFGTGEDAGLVRVAAGEVGTVTGHRFVMNANFSTYTADGLWNANAQPSKLYTPGGRVATASQLLFGYVDYGSGQYHPALGFQMAGTFSNNLGVIQMRKQGEANNLFEIRGDGQLHWGPGGATAPDTRLYRGGTAALYTNATLLRFDTASARIMFMGSANRYNIDNSGDSFRIFRENTDGTAGAVRFSMTDAGSATFSGPDLSHNPAGTGHLFVSGGGIRTNNSQGNLHLDPITSGSQKGHIYLNWNAGTAGGNLIYANGAAAVRFQVTPAGDAEVFASLQANRGGGANGRVGLMAGGASNSGYIDWHTPNGTRQAYMGFNTNNTGVNLQIEQGVFTVSGNMTVTGGISSNTGQMMIGYDSWLRLNNSSHFSQGLYIAGRGVDVAGITRTNGYEIGQVGSGISGYTVIDSARTHYGQSYRINIDNADGSVLVHYGPSFAYTFKSNWQLALIDYPGSGANSRYLAGAYDLWSDVSLKEDIAPLEDPVDKLMAVEGHRHAWKGPKEVEVEEAVLDKDGEPVMVGKGDNRRAKTTKRKLAANQPTFGFIAQEIEEVMPELVTYEPIQGVLTLDYNRMLPVLWEASKKMVATIRELRGRIEALEAKLA